MHAHVAMCHPRNRCGRKGKEPQKEYDEDLSQDVALWFNVPEFPRKAGGCQRDAARGASLFAAGNCRFGAAGQAGPCQPESAGRMSRIPLGMCV
jgi:hypothetical protein